jgi:hypothetical protein
VPGLVEFAHRVSEMCRGKAFFTTPDTLGQYLLRDYVQRKSKMIHQATDHMILCIPPFPRWSAAERMGHGDWYNFKRSKTWFSIRTVQGCCGRRCA